MKTRLIHLVVAQQLLLLFTSSRPHSERKGGVVLVRGGGVSCYIYRYGIGWLSPAAGDSSPQLRSRDRFTLLVQVQRHVAKHLLF